MPDVTRQERKTVTVLFCDLVGFTQLAEEMDPEDVASLLGPYHARVREQLERFGGTVEKFIGDAVMALFGAPVAHEDDPERAIRAAFAIREVAQEQGIELRIGIATGTALVSLGARPEQGETMATGDVVNTAARIEAAAPASGILVSERTHEATKSSVEYRAAAPVEAKGKARPVVVWEAVSVQVGSDADAETPFVGRANDLHLLEEGLARAERERSCQLVTLVGVPGIGKSRLVRELAKQRDDVVWRRGRCLPYGDGITFWALGEIVKAQVGILDSDSPEAAEAKLERAVPDDEWIRESIRPVVGLSVETVDEGDRREETFVAWRRFLEGIAGDRTLVLLFEDLHWADDNLLDFIDHLVDWASGVALLVVCTTRPELVERRPAWGGGKTNALTVSLSPLSDDETARLISRLIEQAVMPAEAQAILLARAGGNPLYTEQFVRMVVERTIAELTVPETVQGIIAARLDLLEPRQKELLQDAAVVGKSFWLGAVAAVAGAAKRDVETGLHALERKGFVRRDREQSIEGDTEYSFLHLLMQEVAYEQIPRAQRADKHRLAAQWTETLGRAEDHAEMLAFHYGEAVRLGRAAGVDTADIERSARRALRDAGDRAFALDAYGAAHGFFERALELWPDEDPERPALLLRRARSVFLAVDDARLDLLDEAREALLAQGDLEAAAEAGVLGALARVNAERVQDALDLMRSSADLLDGAPLTPAKARVLTNRARLLSVTNSDEALEAAREALSMAEELGLEEVRAMALNSVGIARLAADDPAALDDLEESRRLALEHGSPFELRRINNNLAFGATMAGRLEREREVVLANLELAQRYGFDDIGPKLSLAFNGILTGRWPEASRLVDELSPRAEAMPPVTQSILHSLEVQLRLARDDVVGAAATCERAYARLRDLPETRDGWDVICVTLCLCTRLAFVEGRSEVAGRLVDELAQILRRHEHVFELVVTDLALVFAEFGRSQALMLEVAARRPGNVWHQVVTLIANGELVSAADRLAAMETPYYAAAARALAARQLIAGGRRDEADEQLDKALAFYRSVGATRYIRECEALLDDVKTATGS